MNSPPNRTPCHEQQIDRRRHTKTGVHVKREPYRRIEENSLPFLHWR